MSDNEGTQQSKEQEEFRNVRMLGQKIRMKRIAEKLTLERAAEQSGVSAATLSRLERQGNLKNPKGLMMPDIRTQNAIQSWLGDVYKAMADENVRQPDLLTDFIEQKGTPQIVEAYLRADRNLDDRTAKMLSEMFSLAYEQYSALSKADKSTTSEEPPSDQSDQ